MAVAAPVVDLSACYRWERLPDVLTGRVYAVSGYHDGKIYVLGMLSGSCNIYHVACICLYC